MKRVFIATGIYPPESGGPATYTRLIEERLPELGFGVSVLPFRTVRHLPKGIRHIVYFCMCVGYAAAADIVYAQDTLSVGLPAALAAKIAGKPFAVRVPGDYAWEQARQRYGVVDELDEFQRKRYGRNVERMRRLQRFVVRRAKKVIVPSEYMKRIVSCWTSPAKITRIYSSIALPPKYVPQEKPAKFFVVTIARPVPWKGLEGLSRTVGKEPGWELKVINDMPHEEAMGWVKAADVFALNSTYEGLSHALIEALSLGTPVVATNVGGNPEVVGDAGLLIPPKDDEALHEALKDVERNRVAAAERAARGLLRVKEFDMDRNIAQLADVLRTI